MKLDQITVEGFKSIRGLAFKLSELNVLIGANGSGKSNFIGLFTLLNEIVESRLQPFIAKSGGADTFLHFGQKVTSHIKISLEFGLNSYKCILAPTRDDNFVFEDESCYFHGPGHPIPFHVPLGSGHKESELSKAAKRHPGRVEDHVLEATRTWRVYHFHDTSESAKVKKPGPLNDNLFLRTDASNLASFLYYLQKKENDHYLAIRNTIRNVAPFFDDFLLRSDPLNENQIRLEWKEKDSDYPFQAYQLSDGTLRFMCLATLLLQPAPPSTILVDEPELGLHPYAITILAEMMKSAAPKTQVIVSTQSVPLVNQLEPKDIVVVDRTEGQSTFRHGHEIDMTDWLEDYGLGDLWEKNLLGGRP